MILVPGLSAADPARREHSWPGKELTKLSESKVKVATVISNNSLFYRPYLGKRRQRKAPIFLATLVQKTA